MKSKKPIYIGITISLVSVTLLSNQSVLGHSLDGVGETVIHMDESGYIPEDVTIPRGGKVIFENIEGEHWPASNIHPTHRSYPGSDTKKCDTGESGSIFDACHVMEAGESYEFTFNEAGEWRYHDHVTPQIKGTITVEDGELPAENKKGGILENIKSFFSNLFAKILVLFRDESGLTAVPEGITYIEDIKEDAVINFDDQSQLYSYVRNFGPAKTTKRLHDLQPQFGDCHTPAHDVGNYAYVLEGAKAFQSCRAECHSGCYHGATENYFREHGTENLAENLAVICNSELNPFFSHQCVHGIGHGLTAWADYEIIKALNNCDLLTSLQSSCYSGVFMENIIGGLAQQEGHFTDYLSDDPHFPCNAIPEEYVSACYFYQTSRMIVLLDGDFSKVTQACLEAPENSQVLCFSSMGRDISSASGRNAERAIELCEDSPSGNYRMACLSGAVQDFFWDPSGQDNALSFCKLLDDPTEKSTCYNTIFGRAPDVLAKGDLQQFCEKAETEYREVCLGMTTGRNL